MKQKYAIFRDNGTGQLIIQEHAVLDKDIFSLLCEARYEGQTIEDAIAKGPDALVAALRTPNMFPPNLYVQRIAAQVQELFIAGNGNVAEVVFDDLETLARANAASKKADDSVEEEVEIDDLLENDYEDDYDEKEIGTLNSSLKIADDETLDIEDEA